MMAALVLACAIITFLLYDVKLDESEGAMQRAATGLTVEMLRLTTGFGCAERQPSASRARRSWPRKARRLQARAKQAHDRGVHRERT